jgi:hypothetical protein
MPVVVQDVVRGAIKLLDVPQRECVNTLQELLELLPKFLGVEIPTSASGIIIGNTAPGLDDINKLWIRRDDSGRFIGFYIYQEGEWVAVYDVLIGAEEIRWAVGASGTPPEGWIVVLPGDSVIPGVVVNHLVSQYIPDGSGGYTYFAVRYVGFSGV